MSLLTMGLGGTDDYNKMNFKAVVSTLKFKKKNDKKSIKYQIAKQKFKTTRIYE